jgi:undecaprenyl-diphosphatase
MPYWLERSHWIACDRRWALTCHRLATRTQTLHLLAWASRLGDGVAWYVIMFALPWFDRTNGWNATFSMAGLGLVNLVLYLGLKRAFGRPRPFVDCPGICARTHTLDQFSFPSGHTLHAVSYALLLSWYYPLLAIPLGGFALVIAASRVVLGLHYPSDVLAGALTGGLTTSLLLAWRY